MVLDVRVVYTGYLLGLFDQVEAYIMFLQKRKFDAIKVEHEQMV